jgi:hypothetical protein
MLSSRVNEAVLDADGRIATVNASWREFGKANGLRMKSSGVGRYYLDFCAGEPAREVRPKLERLLRSDPRPFLHTYDCHSPATLRWFCMIGLPMIGHTEQTCVLKHMDITRFVLKAENEAMTPIESAIDSEASMALPQNISGRVNAALPTRPSVRQPLIRALDEVLLALDHARDCVEFDDVFKLVRHLATLIDRYG